MIARYAVASPHIRHCRDFQIPVKRQPIKTQSKNFYFKILQIWNILYFREKEKPSTKGGLMC